MNDILAQTLFVKDRKAFMRIKGIAENFSNEYGVECIIGEDVSKILDEYTKRNNLKVEILQYNFKDDELWAFTFLKKGTVFVCVNSGLEAGKCCFALAHELYHIYCYIENPSKSYIKNGSLQTEEGNGDAEDMEANAFAGVLLLNDSALEGYRNRIVDENLIFELMETFWLPCKAVVFRLYECGIMDCDQTYYWLNYGVEKVKKHISFSDQNARSLQKKNQVSLGSLEENYQIARNRGFAKESRLGQDSRYIKELMNKLKSSNEV